jgi:hypothetical protein
MAKGQKRSTREIRKPKKEKVESKAEPAKRTPFKIVENVSAKGRKPNN